MIISYRENEISLVAACLKSLCGPGVSIGLSGPLGVGKTRLVRELVGGEVTSPTYTLQNIYEPRFEHWDLYRLEGGGVPEELFQENQYCKLIEWPEKGSGRLMNLLSFLVQIGFSPNGEDTREIKIEKSRRI